MTSRSPYQDKHNIWSSHSIISLELKQLPAGSRILDVGTATGTMGRLCQSFGLRFSGIEPNHEWAQIAAPYYENIYINTVENCRDDILSGYNAVIFGDILEHTPDPLGVLRRLVRLQENGALFVISLPNVANIWVRMNLLFGRFDYTENGILDRTHLRFFTKKTAIEMVEKSGLKIKKITATPIPLDLVSNFFTKSTLGKLVYRTLFLATRLRPTLLGYQFIIMAQKEQS